MQKALKTPQTDTGQSPLCQLSPELLQLIATHLQPHDLRTLHTTCVYVRQTLAYAGHKQLQLTLPLSTMSQKDAPVLYHAETLQLHVDYSDDRAEGCWLKFAFLQLPHLHTLKCLDLVNLTYTTSELGCLKYVAPQLQKLLLGCCEEDFIDFIEGMQHLQELNVFVLPQLSESVLERIAAGLPALRRLELSGRISDGPAEGQMCLSKLSPLQQLEHLRLDWTNAVIHLDGLGSMTQLKELHLKDVNICSQGLHHLGLATQLTGLSIQDVKLVPGTEEANGQEHAVDDAWLHQLTFMANCYPNLTALDLQDIPVSVDSLARLAMACPQLASLKLGQLTLDSRSGQQQVAGSFPALRELRLNGSSLARHSGGPMVPLGRMAPRLQHLALTLEEEEAHRQMSQLLSQVPPTLRHVEVHLLSSGQRPDPAMPLPLPLPLLATVRCLSIHMHYAQEHGEVALHSLGPQDIQTLQGLRELEIRGCGMSDGVMGSLGQALAGAQVGRLVVEKMDGVSGAGLAALAGVSSLSSLELHGLDATKPGCNVAMQQLACMENMASITVHGGPPGNSVVVRAVREVVSGLKPLMVLAALPAVEE